MKYKIYCVIFFLGIILLIGTAGANDYLNLSFIQIIWQMIVSLLMIVIGIFGMNLEYKRKLNRRRCCGSGENIRN